MATVTQPLRDEHKELLPHVETIRQAADLLGEGSIEAQRQTVEDAYAFLSRHLMPHAQAEEKVLYPVVGRVMGAPAATATMARDHVEIARLTAELGSLRQALANPELTASELKTLRRVLYGLYAMVKLHFAKEEEVYLPLLDAGLSPEEARSMFEAMEAAAGEAKSRLAS